MSDQPAIFIGSSVEGLHYAEALQSVLDRDLLTTVWTYGVFSPSANTLESLLLRASTTDFAALFLTPDDESVIRGEYLKTPRDNLVFELGMFIGVLGPRRVFLLVPRTGVELPSDLHGITPIEYRTDRPDDDAENAVNPAATAIRRVVRERGTRNPHVVDGRKPSVSIDVIAAVSRLGGVVASSDLSLEVRPANNGMVELIAVDDSGLGTAIEVDLCDHAAIGLLDGLGERMIEARVSADGAS